MYKLFVALLGVLMYMCFIYEVDKVDDRVTLNYMEKDGYHGDSHYVVTEDGYILVLQRIVGKEKKQTNGDEKDNISPSRSRPAVLLAHGYQSSAVDYIRVLNDESLPYLLFESGYDVWLGNYRGAPGSRNHTLLDPEKDMKQYCNASVHELGYYDNAAMMDYILNTTEAKKLFYIGISQGQASLLVLLSSRPEYNEKIHLATFMAPGSHIKYANNFISTYLGGNWQVIQTLCDSLGIYKVPTTDMMRSICRFKVFAYICRMYIYNTQGYPNPESMDLARTTRVFEAYPNAPCMKLALHYLQFTHSGRFQEFDYGEKGNLEKYGTIEPPLYDLKKVSAPVALYWGENDCWGSPKDIENLSKSLPNLILNYKVPNKLFNHGDFLVGKDAPSVYRKIIHTMEEFGA